MSPLASELFRTVTSARPEVVWDALPATESPLAYLYGMTADLEAAWLPVLSGLVTHLDRCASPRPATSEETL